MNDLARLGVSAMAPGLWRVALPFPSPLGYSFAYLLRVNDGFLAVDLGWDTDEGWDLFQAGLARAGGSLDELVGVVVTHAHPDHYGLATRVRRETGAWIALHPAEHPQITRSTAERHGRVEDLETWLGRSGVPHADRERLMADRQQLLTEFPETWPDHELLDGQKVPDTGGTLTALHTPGHTPGHLVFIDSERNVLFTGDHLLPRVTANVSRRPTSGDDPLLDYRNSLERIRVHGDALALPGHEWSFDRLDRRIRQAEDHHEERLAEIGQAVDAGNETVWEVARSVSWARPFDSLNPRASRAALGETYAHLVRLERSSHIAQRDDGPVPRWCAAASGGVRTR